MKGLEMSKNFVVLFALILCSICCFSQKGDNYYYYNKAKIDIPINEKLIVVYSEQLLEDPLIEKGYIKDVSRAFSVDSKNATVFDFVLRDLQFLSFGI